MNRGLLDGLDRPSIQFYQPKMLCAANSGTPTNPDLTTVDGRFQYGRYAVLNPSTVYVEMQLTFLGAQSGSSGGVGSGGVYCFSLPPEYPYKRAQPGQIERAQLSPAQGMAYFSFPTSTNPAVNCDTIPVPADPWTTLGGMEDYYFSAQAPYIMDWGSFTIAASSTSVTVNHALGYAFNPEDIEVLMPTNGNTTNSPQLFYVTNITTTQFTINCRQNIGVGNSLSGNWKIRAEPPSGQSSALLGPNVPWDWTKVTSLGPFGNFFFTLIYETQGMT